MEDLFFKEHSKGEMCWCMPEKYVTVEGGGEVWIHHDVYGYVPTPDDIARALAEAKGGRDIVVIPVIERTTVNCLSKLRKRIRKFFRGGKSW